MKRIAVFAVAGTLASALAHAQTNQFECTVSVDGGPPQLWVLSANDAAEAEQIVVQKVTAEQPSSSVSVSGCVQR
jgi:hypothetical protein